MDDKKKYSFLGSAHPQAIEAMYNQYKTDPESVDFGWRKFFEGFEMGLQSQIPPVQETPPDFSQKEFKAIELIEAYRRRGHLFAGTNPVRSRRRYSPSLAIENFGLDESDRSRVFQAGSEIGIGPATLDEIVNHLEDTYCMSIGAEYRYIRHPGKLKWLQQRMESSRNRPNFSAGEKLHILDKLNRAVVFESFLHSRFVGHKQFSLSGGESIIPGLDASIAKGAELGVREFVIGMPHRGRLNVLANILDKPFAEIFAEFEGKNYAPDFLVGDVKYHLGFTNVVHTLKKNKVIVHMVPNPSHLEAVDPYVQGVARSKIDNRYNGDIDSVLPILIHGDAALAAQGILYEAIQMSLLEGYRTGGSIHFVINNQLGFTTDYLDARSSTYCTDLAKVTLSPVFHVNADDAEAVVFAAQLAAEYRQEFNTDVFIDLLGYRKYGHNEADEPRFTQPKLYKAIAAHPDPREIYFQKLLADGIAADDEKNKLETGFRERLQKDLDRAKSQVLSIENTEAECDSVKRSMDLDFESSPPTGVDKKTVLELGERIFNIPGNLKVFDKIRMIYNSRMKNLLEKGSCDWAMGEALAFASLLNEGVNIRLSGQDSERGTFSHRHAVLLVEDTEEEYIPLKHVSPLQGQFYIYNSPLSEFGVLGFEFGYACATPGGLTIWEAQFGDFADEAQVMIDEFISSSEAKWGRMNGLVLFLPHGYEGQGPDHSSARIERFLQLCAHENMQVANCTSPANFFHLLRRHMKWPFRVPLVIFTPKSLLRHPRCTSSIDDFTSQRFQPVIDDPGVIPENVKRVLFCSGKIYYELLDYREKHDRMDTAIVRVEQLFPFPGKHLEAVLKRFSSAGHFSWVQEEPENMGAWSFMLQKFHRVPLGLVSRKENSAPAAGYYKVHQLEQQAIIEAAFNGKENLHKGVVNKKFLQGGPGGAVFSKSAPPGRRRQKKGDKQ
jgi:2-oxoglutarate dehydrogenase E1 component